MSTFKASSTELAAQMKNPRTAGKGEVEIPERNFLKENPLATIAITQSLYTKIRKAVIGGQRLITTFRLVRVALGELKIGERVVGNVIKIRVICCFMSG